MKLRSLLVTLGALVGPGALVAGAYARLAAPVEVPSAGPRAAFDRQAANKSRKTVILGASFGLADLDGRTLHQAMGLGGAAGTFCVGSSVAAVWYAVLKERIYGNGLSPDLILLPVTIGSALTTELPGQNPAKLSEQMPEPDAVVLRRTFHAGPFPGLQRLTDRRTRLRDPVLEGFRGFVPRLLQGASAEDVDAAGRAVFGEHHAAADARLLPVVEADGADEIARRVAGADPAESYLADMVDLADAHGAKVVLVLPPVTPGFSFDPTLTPALERRMVEWANTRGVGWLDLRREPFTRADFGDGPHMTHAAALRFSEIVGKRLVAMGALEKELEAAVAPVHAERVRREGAVPAVDPPDWKVSGCLANTAVAPFGFLGSKDMELLGAGLYSPVVAEEDGKRLTMGGVLMGCTGSYSHRQRLFVSRSAEDAPLPTVRLAPEAALEGPKGEKQHWVYPGGALTWDFAEAWTPADARVEARVLFVHGESATLDTGGVPVPFERDGDTWVARAPVPTTAPWRVSVRSEAAGPFVLVRSLALLGGDARVDLVEPPKVAKVDLLLGGWEVTAAPQADLTPALAWDDRPYFPAPWKNETGCSPLLVREAGALLPRLLPDLPAALHPPHGGVAHRGDRIYFDAADQSDPRSSGRAYTLALDPDHRCGLDFCAGCGKRAWVYPGDVLRVSVSRPQRIRIPSARLKLRLMAIFVTPPPEDTPLQVEGRLGDAAILSARPTVAALRAGVELPLDRPIERAVAEALALDLSLSGTASPAVLNLTLEAM